MDFTDMITKTNEEITPRDYSVESILQEMDILAKKRKVEDYPIIGESVQVESLDLSPKIKDKVKSIVDKYQNISIESITSNIKSDNGITIQDSEVKISRSLDSYPEIGGKIVAQDSTKIDSTIVESITSELKSVVDSYPEIGGKIVAYATNLIEGSYGVIKDSIVSNIIEIEDSIKAESLVLPVVESNITKLTSIVVGEAVNILDNSSDFVSRLAEIPTNIVDGLADYASGKLKSKIDFVSDLINNSGVRIENSIKSMVPTQPDKSITRKSMNLDSYILAVTNAWYIDIEPYKVDENNVPPDIKGYFGGPEVLPVVSFQLQSESMTSTNVPLFNGGFQVPSGYNRPSYISIVFPQVYSNDSINKVGPSLLAFKKDFMRYALSGDLTSNMVMPFTKCTYKITIIRRRFKGDLSSNFESYVYLGVPANMNISLNGESEIGTQSYESIDFTIVGDNYS